MSPHLPAPPLPAHPPWQRTTRNPPGLRPPPVPTTPSHQPTPTPPAKTAAPPRDSGGGAGPTRSSGSCQSGPGQSLPRGLGPPAPQGVGGELPPPASGGVDAAGRMGSHAGRCAPAPGSPTPQPPRAPGPPVCPQAPAADPPGDGIRLWDNTQSPTPHKDTPSPPQLRRTDAGGTHSTQGALRATQHDAPDPPASSATTEPRYPASHRRGAPRQAPPRRHQANRKPDAKAYANRHRYAQGHRAPARNGHNRLTEPKPQHESNPSHTPRPLTLDS